MAKLVSAALAARAELVVPATPALAVLVASVVPEVRAELGEQWAIAVRVARLGLVVPGVTEAAVA